MTKKTLPFTALYYNQALVPQLADVVAPPYDVIDAALQQKLYDQSPYNFCRVDFSKEPPPERYDISQNTWQQWLANDIICRDTRPALYFHRHTFTLPDGSTKTRQGFFAARRLESLGAGSIKPHENTLDGPKEDRFSLMQATHTQLSPVFSLYSDPEDLLAQAIAGFLKTTPFMDFMTVEHERHQLWKVRDMEAAAVVEKALADKPLFIADGHHRYETALRYQGEMHRVYPDLPDDAAANYGLMYFCNMQDAGLVILPIHRVLTTLGDFDVPQFIETLSHDFEVQRLAAHDLESINDILKQSGPDQHSFVLVADKMQTAYLLSITKAKWLASELAQTITPDLADLDVTVLHRLVFDRHLQITDKIQAEKEIITYCKSLDQMRAALTENPNAVAFMMNSTRLNQMETVAMAGHKMPQKSTFFYPKILSGLVMHAVGTEDKDGV